jgi:hypothetical protein
MTEPTAPPPDGATPEGDGTTPETTPPPTAEDVARLEARWRRSANSARPARSDLSEFKASSKASMTETERALAEAREQAAAEVRTQYGARLARTEYIAEAAKRNPGYDVAAVLDDINLARFIGDDGEPDSKAIAASVARLVPEATAAGPAQPPAFDGGARTTAPAGPDMNRLLRQAIGRA